VETSNPVGADIVILLIKFVPDTEKFCALETLPAQEEKSLKLLVVEIAGIVVVCDFGLLVAEVVL